MHLESYPSKLLNCDPKDYLMCLSMNCETGCIDLLMFVDESN